jgi:hypothetical protein
MGNSSSSPEEGTADDYAKFDGIETLGYRVLGVQPDSPADTAGLVSFLDFLVGVNGKMLLGSGEGLEEGDEYDDVDLPALLRENIGKELELCKYNCQNKRGMNESIYIYIYLFMYIIFLVACCHICFRSI